jgi:hypothetical protein
MASHHTAVTRPPRRRQYRATSSMRRPVDCRAPYGAHSTTTPSRTTMPKHAAWVRTLTNPDQPTAVTLP